MIPERALLAVTTIVLLLFPAGVRADPWTTIDETPEFRALLRDMVLVPPELEGDPLAEGMRCLAPLLIMALVHESSFELRNPLIRECGIRPLYSGDHRIWFSAEGRRHFDHLSGIVSLKGVPEVAVFSVNDTPEGFDFVGNYLEEGRQYGLRDVRRLASVTFWALEYSKQEVGHVYFLLEEESGDIVFQPFFTKLLPPGHSIEVVRSRETDAAFSERVPQAAPILEQNPIDGSRRASAGVVLNSRQSPVALYRAMIIAGGLLIAATGAWWFLRVVRA